MLYKLTKIVFDVGSVADPDAGAQNALQNHRTIPRRRFWRLVFSAFSVTPRHHGT